jgi:hypothetical protein
VQKEEEEEEEVVVVEQEEDEGKLSQQEELAERNYRSAANLPHRCPVPPRIPCSLFI